MDVVERLHAGYGEGAPRGEGPLQSRIQEEGEPYLAQEFPNLDQIIRAWILHETEVPLPAEVDP
jgi:peptidyl-prolyl cis-trans isomerase A (cyclophilin A)